MRNVVSKIKTSIKRPKRKAISEEDSFHLTETEVKNFLKILAKLTHSPEEIEDLEGEDREDGTLDIVILAASKLNELLKGGIDSLALPKLFKKALRVLRSFLKFVKTKKIPESFKNASIQSNPKRKGTTESNEGGNSGSKSN